MTSQTITDEQIATLMTEAIEAGDTAQVELCELALGAGLCIPTDEEQREARRACAEAIEAAQAMVEPGHLDVIGVGPATLQCLRDADGATVREDLLSTADSRWQCSHSTALGCESELWTVQVQSYPGIEEDLDRDDAVVIYGVSAD